MQRNTKISLIAGTAGLGLAVGWFGWWRDDPARLLAKYTPAMEWIGQQQRFSQPRVRWVNLPAAHAHLSGDGRVQAERRNGKLLVAFAEERYKGANMWGYVVADAPLQEADFAKGYYTEQLSLIVGGNEYIVDEKLSDRCVKVHFDLD